MAAKDDVRLSLTIEPIGDRVVVRPLEKEQVTASGIVIPDTASGEKPQEGSVIALGKGGIGKDCANPRDFLKIGDRVLFGKYAGDDVKLEGKDSKGGKKLIEVKILHLDSVLCIVH
jgi:chaperonin GroES